MPKLIILQWLRKNKINSISSVYFDLIWLRFFSGTGEWETCPLLITVWIHWKNIRTISNVSLELQSSFLPSTKLRSQLHKARHAPFVVEEEKKKFNMTLRGNQKCKEQKSTAKTLRLGTALWRSYPKGIKCPQKLPTMQKEYDDNLPLRN